MDFLTLSRDYLDPEAKLLEIVERKGLGHPDTLADGLAETVSLAYSRYCRDNFGAVLHHNVDKLFIGGGWFVSDFGSCDFRKPIKVIVNGRMSDSFGGQAIDLAAIQQQAITEYLSRALPNLRPEHLEVISNSTQNTTRPHWFSPRDLNDLPETQKLVAGDTSVAVAHWPRTTCEMLAYELEQYFWRKNDGKDDEVARNNPDFRFNEIGQDIKVMVVRRGSQLIDITVCLPVLARYARNVDDYNDILQYFEAQLTGYALALVPNNKAINIRINPDGSGGYRRYLLGIGSCVECGEEGLVGRGNSPLGVISTFRPYSMEAPAGKNPVYHTGRVMGYLTQRLAKAIYNSFGVKCSVISMAKNSQSLIPPSDLMVYTETDVDRRELEELIEREFIGVDYLSEILATRMIN